ncbi:MAG: AAA family ATPase [Oscillospiraceae bacterium]|nr:AAA family ATPase [Oscillospiraceae bacterium]
MEKIFITGIKIDQYRNINNLEIKLSCDTRKHLIITGKNGSGKTSLLELMARNFTEKFFIQDDNANFKTTTVLYARKEIREYETVGAVNFNIDAKVRKVLMISLPAEHLFHAPGGFFDMANMNERYKFISTYEPTESRYKNILQTMVIMRIQQLEAKENNDKKLFIQSEKWLNVLKDVLSTIYENRTLELKYIPREYSYQIILDGYEFSLNQMADGFSAFFRIVSEIMERMDNYTGYRCDYTLPGIVLIDELETHMHVSMQKMALGFLTKMFPNLQFLVTTHSPFVITSLENAVVYDLSRRESLESPYQFSYESIIEGYYDIDMYSQKMKEKVDRYNELAFSERSSEEEKEFSKLRIEMQAVSPAQKELYIAFNNIEKKRKIIENG